MKSKIRPWCGKHDRSRQLEAYVQRTKRASFGFKTVPEAEKVAAVRQHFDTVARQYDFMNTLLSLGIHYLWKRTAVKLLDPKRGDYILDLCGGTGDLALRALRKVGPGGVVALYDINWKMMAAGRANKSGQPLRETIQYVQGDAESIAMAKNSFDGAMVGFGIRNLTHLEQGFKEMYRVLKPGAKLICLEFSKPINPFFRQIYDIYSFRIMPLIGAWIAGNRKGYTHLPETVRRFPLPEELETILRKIGFQNVYHLKLTNGIAVVHVGVK